MAFVHSLVKLRIDGKTGWCAPVELGEAAPQYISFVIPLSSNQNFFEKYTCEMITTKDGEKRVKAHELIHWKQGSFKVSVGKTEFWFTVRPSPMRERRLSYVGKLGHEDFRYKLVEIEPDDPGALDELYDEKGTFVIGCEPFTHYTNIHMPDAKRQYVEG